MCTYHCKFNIEINYDFLITLMVKKIKEGFPSFYEYNTLYFRYFQNQSITLFLLRLFKYNVMEIAKIIFIKIRQLNRLTAAHAFFIRFVFFNYNV